MAKSTTKEEAEKALDSLQKLLKDNTHIKKIWVSDDDHGYCVNLKMSKQNTFSIPDIINNVKICLFSVE